MKSFYLEDPDRIINKNESYQNHSARSRVSQLYVFTALFFFGQFNVFALRINLSIAIIDMTSNKTMTFGNETITKPAEFNWDSKLKGIILSLFFYGSFLAPVGGYLNHKFGGKISYGLCFMTLSTLTILSPFNLRFNIVWFGFCRIIEGVAEIITFTSMAHIWNIWTTPDERSKLIALSATGGNVGSAITYPICGYIAYYYGWEAIFYFTGGFSLIFSVLWFLLAKNLPPQTNNTISTRTPLIKPSIPWKKILTSKEVWSIALVRFTSGWGASIAINGFPLYVKDLTQAQVHIVGFLSSVPNISSTISLILFGYLTQYVTTKKIFTHNQVHKTNISISLTIASLCMTLMAFEFSFNIAFIYLIIFKFFLSCINFTLALVTLSASAHYSSIVTGIQFTIQTCSMIIAPVFVGYTVVNHEISEWSLCFFLSAFFALISNLIFLFFGSSELQPWAQDPRDEEKEDLAGKK